MASKYIFKIKSGVRMYSKKESSSFWNFFSSQPNKPPIETCKKRQDECDPDLSEFGGQAYRTCGPAYIIQKDILPTCEKEISEEDKILRQIEAGSVIDPMPAYKSVEQRMIDLVDRKLHPLYKRYMELPKKTEEKEIKEISHMGYKCKTGPIKVEDIPENFKISKELLEKKNIFAEFKRVEVPKQMIVRVVEMKKNTKPTLEKKNKK